MLSPSPLAVLQASAVALSYSEVARDSAPSTSSIATGGGQKIIEDAFGRIIVVYVDSSGRLGVTFSNSAPSTAGSWSAPVKSPTPAFAYLRPAAVLVSPTLLRILAEGGTGTGFITDVAVSIGRDQESNILGVSFGTPVILDGSGRAKYPTAILAHNGDILAAWNWPDSNGASKTKSYRWNPALGWVKFSGSSGNPEDAAEDKQNRVGIFPILIQRMDNYNVYLFGNRDPSSSTSTLVFNTASFDGSNWVWGTANLAYEANAAKGIEDTPSLAWDPVRSLVVAAYDVSGTHRYGVFTVDASDRKAHVDSPSFAVSDNDWGTIAVEAGGDYYLSIVDASSDGGAGRLVYTKLASGLWNATVTVLDPEQDNTGASVKRTAGSRIDLLYLKGVSSPATIRFVRISASSPAPVPAPPPVGSGGFTFAAAGDLGGSDGTTASLNALAGSGASFFVAVGDLSYGSITPENSWCNYVKSHVGSAFPFQLVSGNHEDDGGSGGLIDNFAACLPDRMGSVGVYAKEYYFDYPFLDPLARFIMVSPDLAFSGGGAYSYTTGSPHYNWLSNTIDGARAARIPWVIVGMHKVCLSEGSKSCEIGLDLVNLLISKRVDLVLEGHDHDYQRSKQLTCAVVGSYNSACVADDGSDGVYRKGAGTVFVIAGIFGRSLSSSVDSGDAEAPYFARAFGSATPGAGFGFVKYTVSRARVDARLVLATGGSFADSFSLVPPLTISGVSVDPPQPFSQSTVSFSAAVLGAIGTPRIFWDFTGDYLPDLEGNPVTWTYDYGQNVEIRVYAIDETGAFSTTFSLIIRVFWPPSDFIFDWVDFDNNGRVNIVEVSHVVFCGLVTSDSPDWSRCFYWDLNLDNKIDISEVSSVVADYGISLVGPFAGSGQPLGRMDPQWHQLCSSLDLKVRNYCQARLG